MTPTENRKHIVELVDIAMRINMQKLYQVFVRISPHVQQAEFELIKAPWTYERNNIYRVQLYYDDPASAESYIEAKKELSWYLNHDEDDGA